MPVFILLLIVSLTH